LLIAAFFIPSFYLFSVWKENSSLVIAGRVLLKVAFLLLFLVPFSTSIFAVVIFVSEDIDLRERISGDLVILIDCFDLFERTRALNFWIELASSYQRDLSVSNSNWIVCQNRMKALKPTIHQPTFILFSSICASSSLTRNNPAMHIPMITISPAHVLMFSCFDS